MSLKRINLETSINPRAMDSQTSEKPTGTGSEIQLSGARKEMALARLLEVSNPREVDNSLLTSLESITNFPIKEVSRTKYTEYGADVIIQRYEIECNDLETVDKCISQVMYAMTPMPKEDIVKRLALLATVLVKPTGESPQDATIRMKSLAHSLHEYPADIVIAAIRDVQKTCKFWPSYAEFYQHISWRTRRREKLLDSLTKKRVEISRKLAVE